MTEERRSLRDRLYLPPILWPADLAVVLGLPSERAARDFLRTHGVPHIRAGGRVYVLAETLVSFLRDLETRHASREETEARADEIIRQIAPVSRNRRRGRKPPARAGED